MNVYEMVTDRIIKQLEQGIIPWHKPWTGVRSGAYNRISKRPYSIINQMLLSHKGKYASYKQWHDIGGQVKKGAKSEFVVFWKVYQKEDADKDGNKVIRNIPLLRYYNVFHISQVVGVEPLDADELKVTDPIEKAEDILTDYISREGITLEKAVSNEAYYAPIRDTIHLPLISQFDDAAEYYSVAFHEATHSTMKQSRCDRPQTMAGFGSESYSKEELVAEIGSATILNIIGIETPGTFKNSAAYIQNWLQVLRNDNKFVVSASSKAEKAVKYILNEGLA